MEFTIVEKKQISEDTYLLHLKSEYFKMAKSCTNVSWLGKHFKLTVKRKLTELRRYYSSVFVDLDRWGYDLGLTTELEKPKEEGLVKLIFKVYKEGAMTSYLNNLNSGEIILVQGPLGPGFMLDQLLGNYIGFAGGTGLVPFLDLVHYAWREMEDEVVAFHLTHFVSFRSSACSFGIEVLEKSKNCCRGNWFDLIVVTDDTNRKELIPSMVEKVLDSNIDYAWVCGPSGFNRYYHDLLIEKGLAREKIIVM